MCIIVQYFNQFIYIYVCRKQFQVWFATGTISAMFNKKKISKINNRHLSDPVNIQRGLRPGCPLSSFLFVICIEVISNYIK